MARPPILLPVALASLIVLNVIQFPIIESTRGGSWRAVSNSSTGDLIELGLTSGNVRGWYSLHIEIGQRAPESDIVLPRGASYYEDRVISSLYGYGQADSVEQRDYEHSFSDLSEVLSDRGVELLQRPWDEAFVNEGPGRTGFDHWLLVRATPETSAGVTLVAFELTIEGVEYFAFVDSRLVRGDTGWEN